MVAGKPTKDQVVFPYIEQHENQLFTQGFQAIIGCFELFELIIYDLVLGLEYLIISLYERCKSRMDKQHFGSSLIHFFASNFLQVSKKI